MRRTDFAEMAGRAIAGGAIGLVASPGSVVTVEVVGAVIVFVPDTETAGAFVPSGRLGMVFVAPPRVGTARRGEGNVGKLGGAAGVLVCAGANCVNNRVAMRI